jgi:U3 small nucleolar RNA-associated protein MPP10
MDLVANELYDLSDDSENEESYRYEDFFGHKKSSASETKSKKKLVNVNASDESGEESGDESEELQEHFEDDSEVSEESVDGSEDSSGEESDDQQEEKSDKPMTSYGKEKQKLQERIADIESELVEKKSWERRGEVMSGDRPENSLLGLAVAVER